MEKINVQNFKKYYRNNDENAIVARVGHVNAVIEALNAGGGGSGLEGTDYVFVSGNGTDLENAIELQEAYDLAVVKATPVVTPVNIEVLGVFYQGVGNYQLTLSNFLDVNYFTNGQSYDVIINGVQYLMVVNGIMSNILFVSIAAPVLNFSSFDLVLTTNPVVTVLVAPGYYNFKNTIFTINTANVNVVSLTGNRDVIITGNGANYGSGFNNVSIEASYLLVKGLVTNIGFNVASNLANTIIENCKGGDYSFGYTGFNVISTFINCEGGNYSFAGTGSANGTFINCKAGSVSFGNTSPGTFIDCEAGDNSFGFFGSATGLFKNCIAGSYSFGSYSGASGSFYNCTGAEYSFGYQGLVSGTFNNCNAGYLSFGNLGNASGTFNNCIASQDSFGYAGQVSGIFTNCTGGKGSFESNSGFITGSLYYCRITNGGLFQTVGGTGITRLCIDGNNVENNQG